MMREQIDPKELKTLSDILALVLEDQPGQAASALEAVRARARRNGITGGALKNLFVAIAPNPSSSLAGQAKPVVKPRAPRAGSAGATEIQAARTRISQLTADINKLDLDLRGASARIEALRSELHLTRQARAEAQQALSASQVLVPKRMLLLLSALCGLLIGVAGTSAFVMLDHTPPASESSFLR
ncbi:hypothetical protein HN018_05840 [Lichenicola cladoniae]|uniref:Uncharacterized protein n=2 Tax=Lichenicola cladoniae TaxID=1484109 RepID=A0A6M8HMJ8_9PROT|nr:hypothetical protein [Lichenicola cladoniae]NPD67093.1 hypothetical protein [Acetobacteraceae bacterium]QKE89633.1 hypothetical protein HN018_05840 [Lichenicola cladoniae]